MGNRFLKELSLDGDNKAFQIPIKEGVKVLKAFATMAHNQAIAFIKVQLENGDEQLWSAGKHEQGLLG